MKNLFTSFAVLVCCGMASGQNFEVHRVADLSIKLPEAPKVLTVPLPKEADNLTKSKEIYQSSYALGKIAVAKTIYHNPANLDGAAAGAIEEVTRSMKKISSRLNVESKIVHRTVSGLEGREIQFTTSADGKQLRQYQLVFCRGDTLWTIIISSMESAVLEDKEIIFQSIAVQD